MAGEVGQVILLKWVAFFKASWHGKTEVVGGAQGDVISKTRE